MCSPSQGLGVLDVLFFGDTATVAGRFMKREDEVHEESCRSTIDWQLYGELEKDNRHRINLYRFISK